MADTFHFKIGIITRGKGKSVVAKSAYISAEKIKNEWDGETHNYQKKKGVMDKGIILPINAPSEYFDRKTLWNSVELFEKQKNSQLAREFEIQLPKELSAEERKELLLEFINDNLVSKGMVVDYALHDENKGNGNFHAHILTSLRPLNKDGSWGAKCKKEYIYDEKGEHIYTKSGRKKSRRVDTTDWNKKENAEKWRENYADLVNKYLERAGEQKRVDHRSYKRQGINKKPQIHMGAGAIALEKKGIRTVKGDINREIARENIILKSIQRELRVIGEFLISFKDKLQKAYNEHRENTREELKRLEELGKNESSLFSLTEYLCIYSDIQNALAKELPHWNEQRKNKFDFKKFANGISYLQRNNLKTLVDLQEHLEGFNKKSKGIDGEIKANKDKIKDLKSCLTHADRLEENKKVYQEWKKKTIFKDKFYKENEQAIKSYQYSANRIEKITGERSINRKKWSKEVKGLENKILNLDRQREINNDSARSIKHIKYAIDHVNKEYGIELSVEIDRAIKRGEKASTIEKLKAYQQKIAVEDGKREKVIENLRNQSL